MYPRIITPILFAAALACVLSSASTAEAQTTIPGGSLGASTTWTPAGSPYIVQGDIVVPSGGTFVIQAGTEVRFQSGDMLGSGTDTSRVELVVEGTLQVNGTDASPVTFRADSGSATDTWYGITVQSGASEATITHAEIRHARYGVYTDAGGGTTGVTDTLIADCGSYGVYVNGGSPTLTRAEITRTGYGVYVRNTAQATIDEGLIWDNSSYGVYVQMSSSTPGNTVIRQSTIHDSRYGVYLNGSSGSSRTVQVIDSILTSNSLYGARRYNYGTLQITYSDVWGNGTNTSATTGSTGNLSTNPLYAGAPGNLRLTSRSPCRNAGSSGQDIGALPYVSDATSGLHGTLWTNTTLTSAGSPYTIDGDLVVPSGVTLTIQPGVRVELGTGDVMGAGSDTSRTELRVEGVVSAVGTLASPITLSSSGTATDSWYGLMFLGGSTGSTLRNVVVERARYCLYHDTTGTHTLEQLTLRDCGSYGAYVNTGAPTLQTVDISRAGYGVYVRNTAQATIDEGLIWDNSSYGVYVQMSSSTPGNTVIRQSTIHDSRYGVYLNGSSGSSRTVQVIDSIVTSNSLYGARRYNYGTLQITYSDVWGNGTNTSATTGSTGNLSTNPLYAGAPGNLRLTSRSPCRNAGSSGQDIGALPYVSDATSGLHGTLWDDTTLTAGGSPYTVDGDLIVPDGVTLTLEPGVRVNLGTGDVMAAGSDTSRTELRVEGVVSAAGTPSSPITLSSSGTATDSWYGLMFLDGSSGSTLRNVTVERARYCLYHDTTGAHTFERLTLRDCGSYGAYVNTGSPAFDGARITRTGYGVYVRNTASADIVNALLWDNSSYGVYVQMSSSTPASTTIHSSTIHDSRYGVYLNGSSGSSRTVYVRNSLITSNSLYGARRYNYGTLQITYSDVWGNGTNTSATTGSTGNISANPQYVSAPSDFHLQETSLAIDAGGSTGAPDHDLDGASRPLDGDAIGGAAFDMGAFEHVRTEECGNGIVESGESCDDGVNNGMYGYCNSTCTGPGPRCGDGTTNGPEACDDGNAVETDGCLSTCEAASCGDGYVWAGMEECDDGNSTGSDACTNSCESAECGDGIVWAGMEACDDGNSSDTDGCLSSCVVASCGDGHVWSGMEECDDGNSTDTDACLTSCVAATCGDGVVWSGVEDCDDGNTMDGDACPASCRAAVCGNGTVEGTEECDDGNTVNGDACTNACEMAECGDGIVYMGVEDCDDGNTDNTDACLVGCIAASCGDGYVRAGVEACDDGNDDDTDGCTNSCALRTCGDGIVQDGEACDDGNASDTDACLSTCQNASCGDGFRWVGEEECDDGNASDVDECLTTCEMAECGDGYVWDGAEDCDDGNTEDGDGCDAACMVEDDPPADGGVPDAGMPDGGPGDGGTDGGPPDAGMADGGFVDPDAGFTRMRDEGGCGCHTVGAPREAAGGLALGLLVLGLLVRRRRRRGR